MKLAIALGLGLLSSTLMAKELPQAPASCADDVAQIGYCSKVTAPTFRGPIDIQFFVVVDKATFPTVESVLDRYLSFDNWPAYSQSTDTDALLFNKSVRMSDMQKDAETIFRHYYDYRIKSPIGYQKVRGVTYNTRVTPYIGALASLEFVAQNSGPQEIPAGEKPLVGTEGVKFQTGAVHAASCEGLSFCDDSQWLLVYETNLQPEIDLLPKVAATSIQAGIEALLIGMLFNDVASEEVPVIVE
jgi:hypothetical protein